MISIRPANEDDVESLCSLDLVARRESERREFIRRSVVSGACFVAVAEDEVIGYGVLNYTFYANGFVELLYVHSGHRRRGGEQRCYDTLSRSAKPLSCLVRLTSRTCRCCRC